MANKIKSKGTSLLMSISSVYTAVPQVISLDKSGEGAETYDGRTLDGAAEFSMPSNGYVKPPTIGFELFYDMQNTVHIAIKALTRAPTDTNFKLTCTDAGPLSEIWNVTAVSDWSEKYAAADAVKASGKLQCSGPPT